VPLDGPRCFGPGSDIVDADPKLLVATLNDSHILVIGKFCVIGPHLLLLTRDSYRRQRQPLDADDLVAAYSVITTLEPQHFAFYNCCPAAGSSREHKHIQILPRPGPMFPDKPDFDRNKIPFKFFLRYLEDVDQNPAQLSDIYSELLAQARAVLNIPSNENCPHNMVLVREWIMVIPRRSNDFNGVTANSAGMMGYVWLGNVEELDRWKQVGPALALAGLGVPSGTAIDTR
jgi:ATP adenylyltransferase/5',5'''-P-1,P-4-tetraphosphate phosphorylase II